MTQKAKTSKICTVIAQMDGTVFERKLDDAITEGAKRCLLHGKQSKLTIELTLRPLNEQTQQVMISHKMKSDLPKEKGKLIDEDTTETPMYVNSTGHLSTSPEKQSQLFPNAEEVKS